MSDAIYDDVITTESERVEMTVAIYESEDCVRDHEFRTEANTNQPLQRTGSDPVKIRSSRAAVVCLVLLCVLLLTAVIVLCVHIHTNNTNYTQETHQLLTKITNLTKERDQLLTNNSNLTEERDRLLTTNSNHIQLNKQLKQEKNELLMHFDGMDEWLYFNFSFYNISSETKNCNESRRYCTERGADLIIINNRQEQNFVEKMACRDQVWIGLTDSDVEGAWKWVDGTNMTSGFWRPGEPNGQRRENCVVSFLSLWYDYPCNNVFKWICEKKILTYTNNIIKVIKNKMSDAIYDDVIRTESERVEMTVAIYESADSVRDHDFETETNTHQPLQRAGSDCVKIRRSRAAVVCLVLLCVLLLTAVIVLCVHIHINNTNYTQETHQLLTKNNNLTEERDQLLTNNTNLIQLNKKLIQEKNELLKCFNEKDRWFYYQSSCYHISSEKKSWNESRKYCTGRGADLIIINNKEEQNFVMEKSGNSKVWIGLTDIDVEDRWKWVDGTNMTSRFWQSREPNGKRKENCAMSYPSGWHDHSCDSDFKWICEKNI
ncbi:uncharacterized protein [Garra rufa]|uniref:uncharacterized protein n=1 Tax=Garra rufa TaxID=137080 RepID=UPI003CCE8C5B